MVTSGVGIQANLLTICSIRRLCVGGTRGPRVDVARSNEERILEGCARRGELLDILQGNAGSVAFTTGRGDHAFEALVALG